MAIKKQHIQQMSITKMRMLRWIIINKRKDGIQNGEFFKRKGSSY